MTKKELYSLTPEHEAQLKPWADKWIANALKTGPYTKAEIDALPEIVNSLYKAADLEPPLYVTTVDSPMTCVIAACVAAKAWELRESGTSDSDLATNVQAACRTAVEDGMRKIFGTDTVDADRAVRDATQAALHCLGLKPTGAATTSKKLVSTLLSGLSDWYSLYNGGNEWSGWVAYLSFFRHVAKLDIDYSKWHWYEELAKYGPREMHEKFCIVSGFPETIYRDEQNRPHHPSLPFKSYRDGFQITAWHGTVIPTDWMLNKDKLDPSMALTWQNVEQRRALAELIGWAKIIDQLKPRTINKNKDPEIGELLEVDLPDAPRSKFLRVRCGTGRDFVLPVPNDMKTAKQANAWTFSLDSRELKPEIRT